MSKILLTIRKIMHPAASLLFFVQSTAALEPAQPAHRDAEWYRAEGHSVANTKSVPSAIKRLSKQLVATRFFCTFVQRGKKLAAHFYDTSKIRANDAKGSNASFQRDSRLDIFQLAANKSWQRLISYEIKRITLARSDKIRVYFQVLWLDPASKTTPLIYLQVMDNYDEPLVGNRIDVYGVLLEHPKPENFVKFDCYLPYGPSTVHISDISFPDANGNLTLLFTESNPGGNNESAYGWTGNSWKEVGHTTYEFGTETTRRWNGTSFAPLTGSAEKTAPQ